MSIFSGFQTSGVMDEIRCDESSYLVWKWHPTGLCVDKKRENAIRWGSSLRVKDGEAAIFVYNQDGEVYQDYVEGPFDSILYTDNLPILAPIISLLYAGGTPFPAEVYFINLAEIIQVRFGVPFFDVFDPRFADFCVPVAVRGTITFRIDDCGRFIELHRLTNFSLDEFQKQIRSAVCRYVKDVIANAPAANNIPVVQIESKIAQINDEVEFVLGKRLKEEFGVSVSSVDIGAIEIDKTSDYYDLLMKMTRDQAFIKTQAETEDYVERLRIQREESQYAMHKQTQTANFGTYQVEAKTQIGVAGADALSKMGENGVDLDGNAGFNPAAMMAGMAVGSAAGRNIADAMSGTISPIQVTGTVPPPIPTTLYNIVVNGQATGPYALLTLQQMAATGQLNVDTLVWKIGMAEWAKAGTVEELREFLASAMPPIPNETNF